MKEFEKILKAFANRRRLAIVAFLKKEKEATVGNIAEELNLSFKSTSKHLGILCAADILEREQKNIYMFYYLSDKQKEISRNIISLV